MRGQVLEGVERREDLDGQRLGRGLALLLRDQARELVRLVDDRVARSRSSSRLRSRNDARSTPGRPPAPRPRPLRRPARRRAGSPARRPRPWPGSARAAPRPPLDLAAPDPGVVGREATARHGRLVAMKGIYVRPGTARARPIGSWVHVDQREPTTGDGAVGAQRPLLSGPRSLDLEAMDEVWSTSAGSPRAPADGTVVGGGARAPSAQIFAAPRTSDR